MENKVLEHTRELKEFKNGRKCEQKLVEIEQNLNYLETIKQDQLEGMSNTFELILDYFTGVQEKCNSVKMKTRCMKVMVSQYSTTLIGIRYDLIKTCCFRVLCTKSASRDSLINMRFCF